MRQSTSFLGNPFVGNELVLTEAAELKKASSSCQLIGCWQGVVRAKLGASTHQTAPGQLPGLA